MERLKHRPLSTRIPKTSAARAGPIKLGGPADGAELIGSLGPSSDHDEAAWVRAQLQATATEVTGQSWRPTGRSKDGRNGTAWEKLVEDLITLGV